MTSRSAHPLTHNLLHTRLSVYLPCRHDNPHRREGLLFMPADGHGHSQQQQEKGIDCRSRAAKVLLTLCPQVQRSSETVMV